MRIPSPHLDLSGISRNYGDHDEYFAVRSATLRVEPGEFIAIVGKSGSGKSTLLNILGLLDSHWNGSYTIDGVDVASLSPSELDVLRSEVFGFVFQSSFANPYETTARNCALGVAIRGLTLAEQSERVTTALHTMGLAEKADALSRTLSGGERQRLALARALATEPAIVIADEPTGNLDSATGARVMEALMSLNRAGTTVILVTHDPEVAAQADRTLTLRDGTLIDPGGETPPATAAEPAAGYGRPRSGSRRRRTLEQVLRALNNVTSRPMRSLALIAAFGLAFAGLVGAAGIGATASQQIAVRLTSAARDEVQISVSADIPEATVSEWITKASGLDRVRTVGRMAALNAGNARVTRLSADAGTALAHTGRTVAVDAGFFRAMEIAAVPAESASLWDSDSSGRIALVGVDAIQALGLSENPWGAEIWVQGEPFTVVGVVRAAEREPILASSVIVPIREFPRNASQLVIRTEPGFSFPIATALPLALSPANPGNVSVVTAADLQNLRIGVQTDLNGLLGSLALALLALAVLSGASSMFLAVHARVQELALSRALGLSRGGIAAIFLWEGAFLGLAGALAGVSVGMGLSVAIAAIRGWSAIAPWSAIALAPVAGVVCGALAAVVPAIRAAVIDPAEAIR